MAKRPSVKEILEAARKGGAAKPAEESTAGAEEGAGAASVEDAGTDAAATEAAGSAPAADIPTPATLGRPLTLKEKLAAARAGGAPQAAARRGCGQESGCGEPPLAEAGEPRRPKRPVPCLPPAKPLGRPMTLAREAGGRPRRGRGCRGPGRGPAKPAACQARRGRGGQGGGTGAAAARRRSPIPKTSPRPLARRPPRRPRNSPRSCGRGTRQGPGQVRPGQAQTVPPRPTRELAARRRARLDSQPPRLLRRAASSSRGASPGSSPAWVDVHRRASRP